MDDLVGVLVVAVAMLVPIIAIMTKHQHRMALMFREDRVVEPQMRAENETLRKELAEVKQLLYEQAIAIDNLSKNQGGSSQLSERLEDKVK